MRYAALTIVWVLLLASCKEVTFKEAQPAGVAALKEVPSNLRGVFQAFDQTTGDFSDTVIIESWGYRMKDKDDKDWLGRGTLSDTLVLKFYKDYYFLNFKYENQWVIRLIKQYPDGSFEFQSIDLSRDEAKNKELLKKLGKKLKVTEIKKKDDTFYQINPTPAQLMTLIKEGFFTGAKLRKIK